MEQNQIGLDNSQSRKLADQLNSLLANYQVFYTNVRGFHWNITGEKFFELHAKFEELYNDIVVKIDELAERILTLGHAPEHRFSFYLQHSEIAEATLSAGKEAMQNVLDSFKTLLRLQRDVSALAQETGDEGTNALMSDYIREQEKLVWMYSAYLK